jgi:hypothetical protein
MKKPNEHNAIQSALNMCKKFYGLLDPITDICYPDDKNNDSKDVDCVFQIGSEKYALEHSVIESYDGQIEYVRKSYDIAKKVNERLREKLFNDKHYVLLLPPDLIINKGKKYLANLIDSLSDKILINNTEITSDASYSIQFDNSDITIFCDDVDGPDEDMVHRIPTKPKGCEDFLKLDRVDRLLKAKLPKLTQYKKQGYKTILVVEDVSGEYWAGINKNIVNDLFCSHIISSVDIGIRFVSIYDEMIVGSIWKDGAQWHDEAPMENRFKIDGNQAFKLLSHKRKK